MRKTIQVVATVLALAVSAGAAWGAEVSVTLKGGYFFPTGSVYRDVYGSGPVFGAEAAFPIAGKLHAWAGVEFFGKKGLTTITEEEVKVSIIPIYAGVRYPIGQSSVRPYIGAAVGYFLVTEKGELGSASDGGIGLLGQGGLLFRLGGRVWLDLFTNYRACTVTTDGEDPLKAKLDGFAAGLGLVVHF